MPRLTAIELDQNSTAVGFVIEEIQQVDGLDDAAEFSQRAGKTRRAVVGLQRANEPGGLHHAELQGAGKSQQIVRRQFLRQRLHLLQPFDGASKLGRALQDRAISQAIKRTLSIAIRHEKKAFEPLPLLRRDAIGEPLPQPLVGARAHARNGAFQYG